MLTAGIIILIVGFDKSGQLINRTLIPSLFLETSFLVDLISFLFFQFPKCFCPKVILWSGWT